MSSVTIVLLVIIALLFTTTFMGWYFAIRFGIRIIRVQESVEDSLDIIDQNYESISKILEIPLFFDSPEIRKVLKDVDSTRNAILLVANVLTDGVKASQLLEKKVEEETEDYTA